MTEDIESRVRLLEQDNVRWTERTKFIKMTAVFGTLALLALYGYTNLYEIPKALHGAGYADAQAKINSYLDTAHDAANKARAAQLRLTTFFDQPPVEFKLNANNTTASKDVGKYAICALAETYLRTEPADDKPHTHGAAGCKLTTADGNWTLIATGYEGGAANCTALCFDGNATR